MRIKNNTIDIIALSSSFICAIHCAALPILLSFSSLTSLHFLENPYIEWTFISLGVVFVFISILPSYKKNHHKLRALLIASTGFILIAIGRLEFSELWEVSFTVIGALMVSLAHYFNWRIIKENHNH